MPNSKTFNVSTSIYLENTEYFNSPIMAATNFYKKYILTHLNEKDVSDSTMIKVELKDYYGRESYDGESFSVEEIKDFLKDYEVK